MSKWQFLLRDVMAVYKKMGGRKGLFLVYGDLLDLCRKTVMQLRLDLRKLLGRWGFSSEVIVTGGGCDGKACPVNRITTEITPGRRRSNCCWDCRNALQFALQLALQLAQMKGVNRMVPSIMRRTKRLVHNNSNVNVVVGVPICVVRTEDGNKVIGKFHAHRMGGERPLESPKQTGGGCVWHQDKVHVVHSRPPTNLALHEVQVPLARVVVDEVSLLEFGNAGAVTMTTTKEVVVIVQHNLNWDNSPVNASAFLRVASLNVTTPIGGAVVELNGLEHDEWW